jgi:hypothetical protein
MCDAIREIPNGHTATGFPLLVNHWLPTFGCRPRKPKMPKYSHFTHIRFFGKRLLFNSCNFSERSVVVAYFFSVSLSAELSPSCMIFSPNFAAKRRKTIIFDGLNQRSA